MYSLTNPWANINIASNSQDFSLSRSNISSGSAKTEKISVDSEKLDDGQLKSIIEIMITKISS